MTTLVDDVKRLRIGDVIQYDWNGDGRINHSTIVTSFDANGEPLVNAHTRPAKEIRWNYRESPSYRIQTKYYFFHLE